MLKRYLASFVALFFCVSASLCEISAAERPNILLILVDDLKPVLGCYGDPHAKTPNIDALAARGMRFDLAYCNQAVCAPSRFTLMLGSHSTSTGLYGLGSHLRKSIPDAVTLPQHFAKHGYRTESLGKIFHIGHGNLGDPASFSVPHFKEKVIEYVDPASKPGLKLTREEAMFQNRKAPPGGMNKLPRGAAFESPDVGEDAYADGRVAAETVRRLQAAKARRDKDGTPFFIAAGFARPHLPFSAPEKYWDLFDPEKLPVAVNLDLPRNSPTIAHKRGGEIRNYFPVPDKGKPEQIGPDLARKLVHGYYASTSYVDAQIGRVTAELERLGLAENTIVVLWGDHGFHLGDLGIWTKHTNYEQANRIPILISAPGVTDPNTSTKQLAESVDVFPTLAELAGLPAPAGPQSIDGESLVPVLKDPDARVRDHALHAYPRRKLGRAIRTERYRLVVWGDDEFELYDYEADPLESRNHAAEKPEVVARLRKILATYPQPFGKRPEKKTVETPSIKDREVTIAATIDSVSPHGVVLAQGGREHGYGLHFIDGFAALDVRVNGEVTRLMATNKSSGRIQVMATISASELSLTVDGETAKGFSPGLIPVQPKDELSIGEDTDSAAGNYPDGNPLRGTVLSHKITTEAPKEEASHRPLRRNPNIVLIVADDLGYGETGAQGNEEIPTPHIDSIARDGVRFTNGYVTAPVCAPSRAGFLSGRHQRRFGWDINVMPHVEGGSDHGIPASEHLLPELLHGAGYATGMVGKWHLGARADFHPLENGFGEFFGYLHEGHYYVPQPYRGVTTMLRRSPLPDGRTGTWTSPEGIIYHDRLRNEPKYDLHNPVLDGHEPVGEFGYLTREFTDRALSFIDENRESPFFLYFAHSAVHSPLQADNRTIEKFSHIEDIHRRIFAAMLSDLDTSVGRVLTKLEEHGLGDDTLVIFLSDNGGITPELTSSNAPLRGGKMNLYEGGIRVPFMMRWPNKIRPGKVFNHPVSSLDIYATAAEIAGSREALKRSDGVPLLKHLSGESVAPPHDELVWEYNDQRAIRVGEWKAVRPRKSKTWQLFNLADDISESNDLAGHYPERLAELIKRCERQTTEWAAEVRSNLFRTGSWRPALTR